VRKLLDDVTTNNAPFGSLSFDGSLSGDGVSSGDAAAEYMMRTSTHGAHPRGRAYHSGTAMAPGRLPSGRLESNREANAEPRPSL
jgi:hypothetical protein